MIFCPEHDTTAERRPTYGPPRDPHKDLLVQQGVQWTVMEDKAFLAHDEAAQTVARGHLDTVVDLLAQHLNISPPAAEELILLASDHDATTTTTNRKD